MTIIIGKNKMFLVRNKKVKRVLNRWGNSIERTIGVKSKKMKTKRFP